jgi:hypothetical protein
MKGRDNAHERLVLLLFGAVLCQGVSVACSFLEIYTALEGLVTFRYMDESRKVTPDFFK